MGDSISAPDLSTAPCGSEIETASDYFNLYVCEPDMMTSAQPAWHPVFNQPVFICPVTLGKLACRGFECAFVCEGWLY